ncbi:MAG: hypothetical protein J0653_00700, partial [Deltaproteobacteria bacterium]|nr:hypothetical protein [Deltaproteobacteria bacterium]
VAYDMLVSGGLKTNYTAAIQWHYSGIDNAPGFCTLYNLRVHNAKIGLLYGSLTSPVDGAMSENNIVGYKTRGVERPLVINQPNGFLFISHAVLDCQQYEWPGGSWNDTVSNCVENIIGSLTIVNSEFVKASSLLGYGIVNKATLILSACQSEIVSTNFYLDTGSRTMINGYHNNYFNNATAAFIAASGTALINIDGLSYVKGVGAINADYGLIYTGTSESVV